MEAKTNDGRSIRISIPPVLGGAAWALLLLGGLRAIRSVLGAAAADPARAGVLGGFLIGGAAGALAGGTVLPAGGRIPRAAVRFIPVLIALLLFLLPAAGRALPAEVFATLLAVLAGLALGAVSSETLADPGRGGPTLAAALVGGAAGAFLGGWFLLPAAGQAGVLLASVALFLIAAGALVLPGGGEGKESSGETDGEGSALPAATLLLTAAAGAVATIGWVRIGDLVLGSTERNFALLTAAILLGLGGGVASSALGSRSLTRLRTSVSAILFTFCLMLVLFLVPRMPFWYAGMIGGGISSPGTVLRAAALLAALIVLPGAIPLGAAGGSLLRGSSAAGGAAVGRSMVALAAGTALGALAGPRILPSAGIRGLLAAAAAILLLAAIALLLFSRGRGLSRRIALASPLVLVLLIALVHPPRWSPGLVSTGMFQLASFWEGKEWEEYRMAHAQLPSFYRDGPAASVMAIGAPGAREVRRNGWIDGSDVGLRPVEVLLARLPLLFRPDAASAVVLGAATGTSSGMLLRAGAEKVLLVEPEPACLRAIRYFDRVNEKPWKDERFETRVEDPRRFLRRNGPFDVIVCGDGEPSDRKKAHLRTEEFFRLAASRLREGGVAVCPLPLVGLGEDHLRSLLLAFRAAFPEVLVFRAGDRARLILLGSDRPLELRAADALERWEEIELRGDFGEAGVRNLEGLAAVARLDGEMIDRYAGSATPNRDGDGTAEYGTEWRLRDLENLDLDPMLRGLGYDAERLIDFEGLPDQTAAMLHFRIARAHRRENYGPAGLRHAAKSWGLLRTPEIAEMYAHFLRTEANDLDSAMAVARAGLALDPTEAALIRRLAEDLFSARRFEECEEFLTGEIDGGFRRAWVYLIRGKARLALGRQQAGLDDLLEAKEIDRLQDNTGDINFFIGMALKNLGRLEDSQNYLGRTIHRNPRHRTARYEIGENKMLMGEIDREQFEREYLIPNNRARAESLFTKSEKNLYEPAHAEEVERGLITVINSTPNHFGAYFRLAEFYARRGDEDLERKTLGRAIEHFAGRPEILDLTERYLRRTGGEEKVRAFRDLLRGKEPAEETAVDQAENGSSS